MTKSRKRECNELLTKKNKGISAKLCNTCSTLTQIQIGFCPIVWEMALWHKVIFTQVFHWERRKGNFLTRWEIWIKEYKDCHVDSKIYIKGLVFFLSNNKE